jgi:hypothetical protein
MTDRFRSIASRLTDQVQRLVPGRGGDVDEVDADGGDDDDEVETLATVAVDDPADAELAELDDGEDPEPVRIDPDRSLFDLLRELDPTPDLPLAAKHEMGLVPAIERLAGDTDRALLADRRVRRVLDLVGDRLTISVDPDGVAVRGLVFRRHVPWNRIQRLSFTNRYELVRGDALNKLVEDITDRLAIVPIPGLKWLLRRLIGGLSSWLEQKLFTPEDIEALRGTSGFAVTHIQRRGKDIELSGALLLVSILSPGVSEAIEQEAVRHNVTVERHDKLGEG